MHHGSSRTRLLEPFETGLKLLLIYSNLALKELMCCLQFKISGSLFSYSTWLRFHTTLALLKDDIHKGFAMLLTDRKLRYCTLAVWQDVKTGRWVLTEGLYKITARSHPGLILLYTCWLNYFSSKSVLYSSSEVCAGQRSQALLKQVDALLSTVLRACQ